MKRSSEGILQLIAELQNDFVYILENAERNAAMVARIKRNTSPDEFDWKNC